MENRIKKSLICKSVNDYELDTNLNATHAPKVGDVALFRVKNIGKHNRIQNYKGRNRLIFEGDLILCAFGNRYATNQIEGYVPDSVCLEYHILGQGGVVGLVKSMYKPLEEKGPTTLELIGYAVTERGRVYNTQFPFIELAKEARKNTNKAKVILSIGSSMDSGKTTTAGYLCRGLAKAGKRVSFMKLTGTVYTKDTNFVLDCGADATIDFSHYGFPSTYLCDVRVLVWLFHSLMYKLEQHDPEYVVVEIADGLLQRETRALLANRIFMKSIHKVIYSAGDSLSVLSGLKLLKSWRIHPFAVSGLFTAHPLLAEEVRNNSNMDVLTLDDLGSTDIIQYFENKSKEVRMWKHAS